MATNARRHRPLIKSDGQEVLRCGISAEVGRWPHDDHNVAGGMSDPRCFFCSSDARDR